MAERPHALIKFSASPPVGGPGRPAYTEDGKWPAAFRAHAVDSSNATFGFNDDANLDDGAMWLTAFP
jgi:hypothetical protein